jgi:hypothetical protein
MASAAGSALNLIQQVDQDSDEERRKKLIQMQQSRLLPSSAAGAALGRISSGYGSILSGGY